MPFCNITEDVSLHYITNSSSGDVADFDYTKPTIVILPLMFNSVDWMREHFKDRRLSSNYNLIAFEPRNKGLTRAPISPRRDVWVDAADVAVAHELLQLPPSHFFAAAMNGGGAGMRFAALFPHKCLSLCVCSAPVQAGDDPEWLLHGYHEVTKAWCFPSDLEMVERAALEMSWFHFNGQISPDLEDECVAWWQMNIPATKRSNFLATTLCALHRSRLSDAELDSIKQPTLLIQGDKSQISPPHKAQELSTKIPDCKVFVVKGAPDTMNIIPEYASVVNRVYTQFLQGLPDPPAFCPAQPDPAGVCKVALGRLAKLKSDPAIALRDPATTMSFCCLSANVIAQSEQLIAEFAKGEAEAFQPLDARGRPLRRYSERHMDEWKPAALTGMQESMAANGPMVTVTRSLSVGDLVQGDAKALAEPV